MPANDAPDHEWDAWMAVDEVDSIIAGWESSPGRGPTKADAEWYVRAREALQTPGVRELLGDEWDHWMAVVEERRPR
jgi:hypothetical protein